jgi:hypothetical protein
LVKLPLLQHRYEAYRYVRQQLADLDKANLDAIINVTASLALVEAALWQAHGGPQEGSTETILAHIRGIRAITALKAKNAQENKESLFRRALKMYVVHFHTLSVLMTTDPHTL